MDKRLLKIYYFDVLACLISFTGNGFQEGDLTDESAREDSFSSN